MEISLIHSFLVHPGKHLDKPPEIHGTTVERKGRLFGMLKNVFDTSEEECQHQIAFLPEEDKQQNECRDCLIGYLKSKHISEARKIAQRLQKVTTNKSGLGLFFIIFGEHRGEKKILVSRFPADSGILADEKAGGLTVEFLERIFMKSASAYKAAVYSGRSFDKDFWKGRAVDKQINSSESSISNYWIREFLNSDFLTPGEAGTRRFAIAVREAMNRTTDPTVKEEVSAVSKFLRGLTGKVKSAREILEQFNVSDATKDEIRERFPRQSLYDEPFRFVPDEFSKHLAFKTVELSSGALLTASADKFDKVFKSETVDAQRKVVKISTEGKIVDQRFRKAK